MKYLAHSTNESKLRSQKSQTLAKFNISIIKSMNSVDYIFAFIWGVLERIDLPQALKYVGIMFEKLNRA